MIQWAKQLKSKKYFQGFGGWMNYCRLDFDLMNFGKQASYWKHSLKTRFTCESQITNSVGHFQKKSLLSSTSFTFVTCFFNSWELCHIIVGLRDFSASQSFRYSIAMVLPCTTQSCLFLHEMTLVTSCFPFLQQPFEAVAFRVEQTGARSPELQRQDGTVVSCGPGQFGFSSSIASPILEYLHGHFWESWVVEFELISLRDFVTCHLCPFVELLQEQ